MAKLTYLCDFNLDGGVILGRNEPVGGRALARDVQVHNLSLVVLHLVSESVEINNNTLPVHIPPS